MGRREWLIQKIIDASEEYQAATAAVELLEERLRADPSFLAGRDLRRRVARNLKGNLEGTYLIRLFAAFEAGLRDAWLKKWGRTTEPPVGALINAAGATRMISQDAIDRAHQVRDCRNGLVHQGETPADHVGIDECRKYLCEFFSKLPKDW